MKHSMPILAALLAAFENPWANYRNHVHRQAGFGVNRYNKIARKKNHDEKSAELQAQLIARAAAKRRRKAVQRVWSQVRCEQNNRCLAAA